MGKPNALLVCSLIVIAAIGVWGIVDIGGLVDWASGVVRQTFHSRGWFVMLSASGMLISCLYLAFSKYGNIRLGKDDDRPEFSTASWISMLFSAGMGVGLLFWAVAEPLTHFRYIDGVESSPEAARQAMLATNFHWGLHAWAIYGSTALTIAIDPPTPIAIAMIAAKFENQPTTAAHFSPGNNDTSGAPTIMPVPRRKLK